MHLFSEMTKSTTNCRQDCIYNKGFSIFVFSRYFIFIWAQCEQSLLRRI